MDSTGIFSEKPRPANPYVAWAPGEQRGFRGFISILKNIFLYDKNYYLIGISSIVISLETFYDRPKNPQKPPNPRFSHRPALRANDQPHRITYTSLSYTIHASPRRNDHAQITYLDRPAPSAGRACLKPPTNPTQSTRSTPTTNLKALQDINGVDYVNYVE